MVLFHMLNCNPVKSAVVVFVLMGILLVSGIAVQAIAAPNENATIPEIETITFIDKYHPIHEDPNIDTSLSCEDTSNQYSLISGGLKWNQFPVKYYIDAPNQPSEQAVKDAFDVWDDENHGGDANGNFFSLAANKADADITVEWAPIDGSGGTLGFASTSYYPSLKEIISVRIVLDSLDTWNTVSAISCPDPELDTGIFNVGDVATHEIGHAIGFDHVNSPNSLYNTMYTYVILDEETHKMTLGDGERIGIESLYGSAPADPPTEDGPDCSKSKSKKWC